MGKFLINSTPIIVGVIFALFVANLCTKNYDQSLTDEQDIKTDIISITTSFVTSLTNPETTDKETGPSTPTEEVAGEQPSSPDLTESDEESENLVSKFDYIPMSQSLKDHVKLVSSFYEFDEELIYQIIYRESRFNPKARNGSCVGLMQINTMYSSSYLSINDGIPYEINKDSDVYDPYINIILGVRVLDDWRRMGSKRGNKELNDWLCYYNMGWSYEKVGSNGYDKLVLGTDLESIDFSGYKVVE